MQCLAESSSYFDAKLLLYFEIQANALKFCSTLVQNPYSYLLLRLLKASISKDILSMTVIVPCLAIC